MRYLLLAGAAALAFAAGPAIAGGPTPFLTIKDCIKDGFSNHAAQVQCGANIVNSEKQSFDNLVQTDATNGGTSLFGSNIQSVMQTQTASFPHKTHLKGTVQLQVGQNIVSDDRGGNNQSITQTQWLTDDAGDVWGEGRHDHDHLLQFQSGQNLVPGGYNNTQSITQNQTLTATATGNSGGQLDQVQRAQNKVAEGQGNTQSITQSQTLTLGGSSEISE